MEPQFDIESYVYNVVADLQDAGFETYIVGGAIRDLLQNRTPKDYDISTAATPAEVKKVFGRRARIIGRRFQLVHVSCGREILEVSTFRRAPAENSHTPLTPGASKIAALEEAENMIFNDNDFGTSEEDAWRRDFTVNALFYDPVEDKLLDYTGSGIADIEAGLVRAIGEPKLRFEEDPVRMIRALKLVGQYGFVMEEKTRAALLETLPMLELASTSRLSLELEKVMQSSYAGSIMATFQEYGLLEHFLPWVSNASQPLLEKAILMLKTRDKRVRAGFYRASISLAMASFALPFLESFSPGLFSNAEPDEAPPSEEGVEEFILQGLLSVFAPLAVVRRLSYSACRMLVMQSALIADENPSRILRQRSFAHAMELFKIRCECGELTDVDHVIARYRKAISRFGGVNGKDYAADDESDGGMSVPGKETKRGKHRPHRRKRKERPAGETAVADPVRDEARIREEIQAAAADLD